MSTKRPDDTQPKSGPLAYEFHSRDWNDPFPHHFWCEITDRELFEKWTDVLSLLAERMTVWHLGDERIEYDCSYHPELRPMLVCIWGIQ